MDPRTHRQRSTAGLLDVEAFVTEHLPHAGCPVLEVGCGSGELALALVEKGFAITAIDPDAPEGDPFERVTLEDFIPPHRYDAVVAARSLHHIHDLPRALEKIHAALNRDGVLILDEFAWDQMDQATASWYVDHLSTPADEHDSLLPGKFPDAWISEHEGMHDSHSIRSALGDHFDEAFFETTPYIARNYLERPDLIEEERRLIRAGDIRAIGFRFVGIPK